jgi:hypothetical protein
MQSIRLVSFALLASVIAKDFGKANASQDHVYERDDNEYKDNAEKDIYQPIFGKHLHSPVQDSIPVSGLPFFCLHGASRILPSPCRIKALTWNAFRFPTAAMRYCCGGNGVRNHFLSKSGTGEGCRAWLPKLASAVW